jgi:hypothetical protein
VWPLSLSRENCVAIRRRREEEKRINTGKEREDNLFFFLVSAWIGVACTSFVSFLHLGRVSWFLVTDCFGFGEGCGKNKKNKKTKKKKGFAGDERVRREEIWSPQS